MKNIQKALLISGITLGLFCSVANVNAFSGKSWTDSTPKIRVKSEKDFDFSARVSIDKVSNIGASSFNSSFNGTLSKKGLSYLLHNIQVRQGQTLTFTNFEITDVNGNPLANCNLLENTLFVAGASKVKITVSQEGCIVN